MYCSDYRLCPEFKYPAQMEDLWGVMLWIEEKDHAIFGSVDFKKLVIGGDSAGINHTRLVDRC